MTQAQPARDSLARLHSALGVLPLGAYLIFHLWEQWPALESREAWVDRARSVPWARWQLLLVLVPLLAHGAIGLARLIRRARAAGSRAGGSAGLARVQAATGIVGLVFIVFHVAQLWPVASGPHAGPRDSYAVLWQTLGQPAILCLYLVGITCVCFHFAHGLTRAAETWGLVRDARAVLRARYVGGVFGFALWVGTLQLVAHFALGEALVPLVARSPEASGSIVTGTR